MQRVRQTIFFAMTSLQPVDEAVQMIKDYYVYLIIFVLIFNCFDIVLLLKKNRQTTITNK